MDPSTMEEEFDLILGESSIQVKGQGLQTQTSGFESGSAMNYILSYV